MTAKMGGLQRWIANGRSPVGWRIDDIGPDAPIGLQMLGNPVAIVPKKENLPLIATAPELLQQLEHICAEAESWHATHHGQTIVQCDAICKAIPKMRDVIRRAYGEAM